MFYNTLNICILRTGDCALRRIFNFVLLCVTFEKLPGIAVTQRDTENPQRATKQLRCACIPLAPLLYKKFPKKLLF